MSTNQSELLSSATGNNDSKTGAADHQHMPQLEHLPEDDAAKIMALHQALIDAKTNAADRERQLLQQEESVQSALGSSRLDIEQNMTQKKQNDDSLAKLETAREEVQRRLDQAETEDNEAAYELHRLEETKTTITARLDDVNVENADLVKPELKRLKRVLTSLQEEREEVLSAHAKESSRLQKLESMAKAHVAERVDAEAKTKEKRVALTNGNEEPKLIAKQMVDIEKQVVLQTKDIDRLDQRINDVQFSIGQTKRQRKDVDDMKKSLDKSIESQISDNESKQREACGVEEKIDLLKTQYHTLATNRLEIELALKEGNERLRHSKTTAALEKRQLDVAKRMYIKKRQATDEAKDIIPQLQTKLEENQASLVAYEKQTLEQRAIIDDMKQKSELKRMRLMRQENVGKRMEDDLLSAADAVENKEAQIDRERTEEKKLCKVIAVMEAQRDSLRRKAGQVLEGAEDVEDQIKLKRLSILDLQKLCSETNKRCREFAALYESMKSERDSCTGTIQASERVVAELKIKVAGMESELDKLKSESREKSTILSNEYDAHEGSLATRATLRAERNRIRALLREKSDHVERQKVQIDKLRSTVSCLEKDVKRLQTQKSQTADAKRLMTEQLEDRKKELCRCYERASLYEDTLEKGEVAVKERRDYIRMLTLEHADLRRTVEAIKSKMPDINMYKERIIRYEADIVDERERIEELSKDMEDPKNGERARPLKGDDLEGEQLVARIDVLERRLSQNRTTLVAKEAALQSISVQTKDVENRQIQLKEETQPLILELNTYQGRLKDMTKSIISLMGELRMYQSKIVALTEQKEAREEEILASKRAVEAGKPPSDEAWNELRKAIRRRSVQGSKSAVEDENAVAKPCPRPNAYIPIDCKAPKPFGATAPFKPTHCGSNIRHYREPMLKEVETGEVS